MKSSNISDFREHLLRLGYETKRNIIVHSKLTSFGVCKGEDFLHELTELIRTLPGSDATIVVPAYVSGGNANTVFDRRKTPPTNVGALSAHIFAAGMGVRSRCPIHSHIAIGRNQSIFEGSDFRVSLGPASDFERLAVEDFWLLLLGCRFSEGATHLHHLEAVHGAPYRHWVELDRRIINDDGELEKVKIKYFARKQDGIVENFDRIESHLTDRSQYAVTECHYGRSHMVRLRYLEDVTRGMLSNDPTALVRFQRN